mmetsp:Transcript_631/g.1133  ORF Transcript_631/g.1133 Transcript_631/m.1133 type:complete len:208 (+) Transcript_631:309-932(+)
MPHKQISIQSSSSTFARSDPIIIVRSTSIVTKGSISFVTSNSHQENSLVFLTQDVLAFFWTHIRIVLHHFIGRCEMNLWRKHGLQAELLAKSLFSFIHSLVDLFHSILKLSHITITGRNPHFPIPLIHIQRMGIIDIIISSNSTEISYNSMSFFNSIIMKRPTLPLCKRMRNFKFQIGIIPWIKRGRFLNSIQVIIESRLLVQKQWC